MRFFFLFVLMTFSMALIGCGDDDPVTPPPAPPWQTQLPFPATPELLMANFETAHDSLDVGVYQGLLHADFEMLLQQETTEQFPLVGTSLDYAEEMTITERMFSGDHLTGPSGSFIPGMQRIIFYELSILDAWAPVTQAVPDLGTHVASYSVRMIFDRGEQYATVLVEGLALFYATESDSIVDGETLTFYQLSGMVDRTRNFKAAGSLTWGSAKAWYWSDPAGNGGD